MFRDVFKRYPRHPQQEVTVQSVGEEPGALEAWRETCTYWMMKGWNPDNMMGLMEVFNEKWLSQDPASGFKMQAIDGLMYKVYPDGDREIAAEPK